MQPQRSPVLLVLKRKNLIGTSHRLLRRARKLMRLLAVEAVQLIGAMQIGMMKTSRAKRNLQKQR